MSPHSHVIVIGGLAIPIRLYGAHGAGSGPVRLKASVPGVTFAARHQGGRRSNRRDVEVERGSGSGRGTPAPQDPSLVRRLRDRARQSRFPARIARVLGRSTWAAGAPRSSGGITALIIVPVMVLYSELAAMFPDKSGGFPIYANEALAQVHDDRRSDRDVRLLDRLVGRARVPRPVHRLDRAGGVVPEGAVRDERVRRRSDRQRLLLDRQRPHRAPAPDRDRDHPLRLGCSTSSARAIGVRVQLPGRRAC